jgi:hypothetical protein
LRKTNSLTHTKPSTTTHIKLTWKEVEATLAHLVKVEKNGLPTRELQEALVAHAIKLELAPKSYVKKEKKP